MTPEELAQACADYATNNSVAYSGVDRVAARCSARIMGIGRKYQISPNEQGFERATVGTMLVGKLEELVDEINYGAMVDVLISRLPEPREDIFESLRMDLQSMASWTVESAILVEAYLEELQSQGLYEPRPEEHYEDQLRGEQVESLIKEQGLSDMGLSSHDG